MQRLDLIRDYRDGFHSVASLARKYSISEKTAWKWIARWNEVPDPDSLRDRSRAPHHCPVRMDPHICDLLLSERAEHSTWGSRKLLARLQEVHPHIRDWPSPSSAGELLKRHGLVPCRKLKRHATPSLLLEAPQDMNDVWAMDNKGWWKLRDNSQFGPFTLTELTSRYLLRAIDLERNTEAEVRAVLTGAFAEYGMPKRIRSDNGPPFASTGRFGLTRLGVWLIRLGIEQERIQPGKPQQNGCHERMHLTMQNEVATKPAANRSAQQKDLDAFRHEFNFVRPHEALGQVPPARVFHSSPRPFPEHLAEYQYERGMHVRTTDYSGRLRLEGKRILVGAAFTETPLGLKQAPEDPDWRWQLWLCNHQLGWIDQRTMTLEEKPFAARAQAMEMAS